MLAEAKSALVICGGDPVVAGAEAVCTNGHFAGDASGSNGVRQGAMPDRPAGSVLLVQRCLTRAAVDEPNVIVFVGCRAGSVTTERWRSREHPDYPY